ncbi:hypothetical protein LX36DRAFT_663967 [Colletotrichum falcatum]|nr:hypothetical protein LX36DRAFT_663967 [Colletotrichum falcatum]
MAAYKNIVNPSAGALIFADNTSPEHSIRQYRLRGAAVPDLHQLSDFAFFEWVKGCQYKKANPRDLKVVFRTHIVYAPTFALVAAALMDAGYKRIPTWENRATIKMGTRPGDAILGSTHGSGTALMLIQHKDVLGVKEIVEAVVWGSGAGGDKDGFDFKAQPRQVDLNIRFTIRNA